MRKQTFELRSIMKRIIEETESKIMSIRKKCPKKSEQLTKNDFFINPKYNIDFPVSRSTYDKYYTFARNKNASRKFKSIDIETLYAFCIYNNCSADYFLGFIETKRKEASAPQIRDDFGLSDKAMNTLSVIRKNSPEVRGELSSDIMNLILEDTEFWDKINIHLPLYIALLTESRTTEVDIDMARYGLTRAFEEMIDRIAPKIIKNNNLPTEKLSTSIYI